MLGNSLSEPERFAEGQKGNFHDCEDDSWVVKQAVTTVTERGQLVAFPQIARLSLFLYVLSRFEHC